MLRLGGERAQKKVAHWQGVALAASEQSGRTRVLQVAPVQTLTEWLRGLAADGRVRWMLSFTDAQPLASLTAERAGVVSLSGPEGGLSPSEEAAARAAGFVPVSLGARVLRADTAPLALLAHLSIGAT